MARYSLAVTDFDKIKTNIIKIYDMGFFKDKVDLMVIDRFMIKRNIGNNKYESFSNEQELIDYIIKNYNIDISNNYKASIRYKSFKKDEELKIIYGENRTIEYFSQMFIYYKKTSNSKEEMESKICCNTVWGEYANMFIELIGNPHFYNYMMNDIDVQKFTTFDFKEHMVAYYKNKKETDGEGKEAYIDAIKFMRMRMYKSYKTIRGLQLAIDCYNKKYNLNIGLNKEYLETNLAKINNSMPINELVYNSKNSVKTGDDDNNQPNTIFTTGNEELDDLIALENSGKPLYEIMDELDSAGLDKEDIMVNYPELATKLGYLLTSPEIESRPRGRQR